MTTIPNWIEGFPGAVTVCDPQGIILYMNEKATLVFAKDGGRRLIGSNLLDCHPGASREKVQALLDERKANVYTIEKNGIKKLIYQTPWYEKDEFAGLVELSLELPGEIPHFIRS
ncbi:MAG TPA: PAS domain-containing protein [Longilinea sp.]|nr:PAS domain-containing protein [Longilinea sp.]